MTQALTGQHYAAPRAGSSITLTVMFAAAPPPPPAHAAATPPVTLRGRTSQGSAMTLTLRGGRIVRVRMTVERYVCVPEGDIAPLEVSVAPGARVGAAGAFGFTAGPPSERLRVDGRIGTGSRTARGSLRLSGTIGTGDPCRSPRITFALALEGLSE